MKESASRIWNNNKNIKCNLFHVFAEKKKKKVIKTDVSHKTFLLTLEKCHSSRQLIGIQVFDVLKNVLYENKLFVKIIINIIYVLLHRAVYTVRSKMDRVRNITYNWTKKKKKINKNIYAWNNKLLKCELRMRKIYIFILSKNFYTFVRAIWHFKYTRAYVILANVFMTYTLECFVPLKYIKKKK